MDMFLKPFARRFTSKTGRGQESRIGELENINIDDGQKRELKERDAYDSLGCAAFRFLLLDEPGSGRTLVIWMVVSVIVI